MITDLKMAEEDNKLCMCPNLGDKLNNLSVVAQLSTVTSGRTGRYRF